MIPMPSDDYDMRFIFITESYHFIALIISLSVNYFFFRKANKGPLLKSYLILQGAIILWIISKIGKTLAPTIELRWFFIVTQYLSVCFLGPLYFFFSWHFALHRIIPRAVKTTLCSLSSVLFIIMATNPLHYRFYSSFDFYHDKFGLLFYVEAAYTYTLILLSIALSFRAIIKWSRSRWDFLIGMAAFIPLLFNIFYLMDIINPLFDITPLMMTGSLILFATAAYRSHFLGLLPVAHSTLLNQMEDPLILTDRKNRPLRTHVLPPETVPRKRIEYGGRVYRVHKIHRSPMNRLYHYVDITEWERLTGDLDRRNRSLEKTIEEIQEQNRDKLKAVEAQWLNHSRRELHDILGHSLTQIIMLMRTALLENMGKTERKRCLSESARILDGSLTELKGSLAGEIGEDQILSIALQRTIEDFSGRGLLDFTVRGKEQPFPAPVVSHLIRCCQEGITNSLKHGGAERIYLILLFGEDRLRMIISDTGKGCANLNRGNGLTMMGRRIEEIGGTFKASGEPGEGVQLTITVPYGKKHFRNIS